MKNTLMNSVGRGDYHNLYKGRTIDDLIIQYMEENHVPGMALAIVQAPYITRVVGYGLADLEKKLLVASNTVFNVGQLTNAFTAVAIMQLKEDNKLKLDDKISQYLENLPKSWAEITIRHLLTHTSGLPAYNEAPFDYTKTYTLPDIIKLLNNKAVLFEAGTHSNQSVTDHYLLGSIIEKVSGMSYEAHVTENQINRVGLKHTCFISNASQLQNETSNGTKPFKHSQFLQNPQLINPTELAKGYQENQNELAPSLALDWTATYADSGVIASAEDISLWDIALAGGILIKELENRQFIYNPISLKDGQKIHGNSGWFFPGHPGLMEIKGNIPGFSSFLARFTAPDELVCVTLLANKGDLPDLDILGRKIAAAFDPKLGVPDAAASWSETIQSPYPVAKTIERVKAIVKAQGGTIFAHIHHSDEAIKAGQTLPPTEVVVLGNPAVGTQLMQTNPAFALDLPLRVMATEDKMGQIWLSFTDPLLLAKEYGLDDKQLPVLQKIANALTKLCERAISPVSIG